MLLSSPGKISRDVTADCNWAIPRGDRVVAIIDHSLLTDAAATRVLDTVRIAARSCHGYREEEPIRIISCERSPDMSSICAVATLLRSRHDAIVVAIGGGATMDTAALATLWAGDEFAERRSIVPQRSGVVFLPTSVTRRHLLMAVPTTIGTGAETSHSACFLHEGLRRLVISDSLRADAVLYDRDLLAGTPEWLVRQSLLEIFFRLSVAVLGVMNDRHSQGDNIVNAVRENVRLGDRPLDPDARIRMACLSASSHSAALMAGVDPFAGKLWYIATEMSDVLGVRKVDAMATLFPAMFTLIERGKQVWGSRTRLEYLWNIVRSASVENLPIVAHEGIRVLLKHWRIAGTSISPSDIDLIVQRSICRWGGGLPMLSGIRSNDVCDLLKLCIPAVTLDKHNSQDHPGSRMETSKPYNV